MNETFGSARTPHKRPLYGVVSILGEISSLFHWQSYLYTLPRFIASTASDILSMFKNEPLSKDVYLLSVIWQVTLRKGFQSACSHSNFIYLLSQYLRL